MNHLWTLKKCRGNRIPCSTPSVTALLEAHTVHARFLYGFPHVERRMCHLAWSILQAVIIKKIVLKLITRRSKNVRFFGKLYWRLSWYNAVLFKVKNMFGCFFFFCNVTMRILQYPVNFIHETRKSIIKPCDI